MKRKLKFRVTVIGCNAETFRDNYSGYILKEWEGLYESVHFVLYAPIDIFTKIQKDEEYGICIEPESITYAHSFFHKKLVK